MSTHLPWPLMARRAGDNPYTDEPLAFHVEHYELRSQENWRCHENDRADAEVRPATAPALRELLAFTSETVERFGYNYARSFVAAVLNDDMHDEQHAALMANVQRRFGRRGLLLFAGFLTVHYDAHDRWMGRSSS